MKYILSDSMFFHQKYGGVTRYTINLFANLLKEIIDKEINLVAPIYKNKFLKDLKTEKKKGFFLPKYPNLKLLRFLNNFVLKHKFNDDKIRSIHNCYYPEFILNKKVKKILTIHDLIHEKNPEKYKKINFDYRKKIINQSDHIICVSKKTKEDLIEIYKINEKKIDIIYHGSDHLDQIDLGEYDNSFFKHPYLLFVGSRKKYKNFEIFLKAFCYSKKIYNDFKIICFGNEKLNNITEKKLHYEKKLILINGNDATLKKLYLHSRGLILTSNDEGFGLPILEALRLGCNVFAPKIEVFSEIFGENIFYFEKNNFESLKASLENYLYDEILLEKKKISGKYLTEKFKWNNVAHKTFALYH